MLLAGGIANPRHSAVASAERLMMFAFMVRSEIEAHAQSDGAGRPVVGWVIDFQRVQVTEALGVVLVVDRRLVLRRGQIAVIVRRTGSAVHAITMLYAA